MAGNAPYVQLFSLAAVQASYGYFDGRSSPPPIFAGTGFTVARNAVGNYTVTFSTAFKGFPGLGVSTGIIGDNIVKITGVNTGNFTVQVSARGTGAAADDFVSFTALG